MAAPDERSRPERLHPQHRRGRPRGRQERRARRHALSARAERLPPHRPRQGDLPRLRRRRGERRHLPPALRRHQPDRRGGRVRRRDQGRPALARLRLGRARVLRLGLLRPAARVRREADRAGQGLRLTISPRRRSPRCAARSPSRAPTAPTARAASRRTSTCSSACARGEFENGEKVLRAKIDMASPNLMMRDPILYRVHKHPAPPHRRRLVHLPDVRLRALPVGLDRGHHPLAVHARVRRPPRALRLDPRRARGGLSPAADRVRAARTSPTR